MTGAWVSLSVFQRETARGRGRERDRGREKERQRENDEATKEVREGERNTDD